MKEKISIHGIGTVLYLSCEPCSWKWWSRIYQNFRSNEPVRTSTTHKLQTSHLVSFVSLLYLLKAWKQTNCATPHPSVASGWVVWSNPKTFSINLWDFVPSSSLFMCVILTTTYKRKIPETTVMFSSKPLSDMQLFNSTFQHLCDFSVKVMTAVSQDWT